MFWQWYKPNQGPRVRLTATLTVAALAALAASEVYIGLVGFGIQVRLAVPVAVLAVAVGGGVYVLNLPVLADFLIEAESELAKVFWPTRQQVLGSTGTVLVVVLILSIYLVGMDMIVGWFLRSVLKLYQ
jgi:preprotein translocase subunit SecE